MEQVLLVVDRGRIERCNVEALALRPFRSTLQCSRFGGTCPSDKARRTDRGRERNGDAERNSEEKGTGFEKEGRERERERETQRERERERGERALHPLSFFLGGGGRRGEAERGRGRGGGTQREDSLPTSASLASSRPFLLAPAPAMLRLQRAVPRNGPPSHPCP